MLLNDPISDMITRIRNAQKCKFPTVESPVSKMRVSVLEVLQREGYIRGYTQTTDDAGRPVLSIELKYQDGQPVIQQISKVSKPGRRVYSKIKDLPLVSNGLGIAVISTPKGMMSDAEARTANIGGEVILNVF